MRGADSKERHHKADRVEERSTPPTPVIYEIVRRYGNEEMARPAASLWWSGLAAGLSMSFSLLTQAILASRLPDTSWRSLVVSLGYPIGFVMVVLGRQQLFTENTITVVLPVMASPTAVNFGRGARMWSIVLAANIVGTLFAALFCTFTPVIGEDLRGAMLELSRNAMQHDWLTMGFRGITAGFLMAAMVWLIPAADQAQLFVIMLITYVIGVGEFPHIIAGATESFLLVANGQMGIGSLLAHFFLPVLAGNIIGGTALFAVLSYAQVMKEI